MGLCLEPISTGSLAFSGGVIVVVLIAIAVGAPLISPHDPCLQYPESLSGDFFQPLPPRTGQFPLGTESLGRDFLSRLIWGGRIGYKWPDWISIGLTLIALSLPGFWFGLVLLYLFGFLWPSPIWPWTSPMAGSIRASSSISPFAFNPITTGRGQEAIPVGTAHALGPDDEVAPMNRDLATHLIRGVAGRFLADVVKTLERWT